MKKILFVCTGNTCRSPMAEAAFNALSSQGGIDAYAESAGVGVYEQTGPTIKAVRAMKAYSVDITNHKSRQINNIILGDCHKIYCMTAGVMSALKGRYPNCAGSCALLDEKGIPDPFGGTQEDYDKTAEAIIEAVKRIILEMKNENV